MSFFGSGPRSDATSQIDTLLELMMAKGGKVDVSLDWFNLLYQVLLGQEKGPRFGSFVAVCGLQNTMI
jgi:lysyl-tRNA synthetase class I